MIRKFAKIWALLMLLVITSTSSGMSINRHLCGGHEKSKSFILKAEKCTNESKSFCLKHGNEDQFRKTPCCSDHSVFLKQLINVDFGDTGTQVTKFQKWVPVLFNNLKESLPKTKAYTPLPHYRPPPLVQDVTVVLQNFRL